MKRSAQVALVVMTAATVGGVGYAMMPSEKCQRVDGGAPLDPVSRACRSSGSGGSGSGYYHGSRSFFGSSDSGGSASTATKPSTPSAGGVTTRGGFGSFFSSLGSHISGS